MVYNFIDFIRSRTFIKRISIKKQAGFLKRGYERELLGSVITLKNLALVSKERPLAADYIYELLMENSGKLKPIYQKMISIYRNGNVEEAFIYFGKKIGTRSGRNFAAILSKLDKINPVELTLQMKVFQEMMGEERMTSAMKKAQRDAIITTVIATAGVFALLINFTVVVVMMDTLNMLRQIF